MNDRWKEVHITHVVTVKPPNLKKKTILMKIWVIDLQNITQCRDACAAARNDIQKGQIAH